MKMKKIAALICSILTAGAFSFAEEAALTFEELQTLSGGFVTFDTEKIAAGLNDFASALLVSAPQAATQQNVWADSYLGQEGKKNFNFGAGATLGGTRLNMIGLKDAATSLSEQVKNESAKVTFGKIPDTFFLPVISLDARIDCILIPLDIGLTAMMTNPSLFDIDFTKPESILSINSPMSFTALGFDGTVDYLTVGFDVRYCINKGQKLLPFFSIGAGYNYTKGAFSVASSTDSSTANMNVAYNTQVIYLQAQASKEFFNKFTLFGGARGLVSKTETSWAWDVETEYSYKAAGITQTAKVKDSRNGSVSADTKSEVYQEGKWNFSGIQPQVFAGVGFNFSKFQTTLSACIDIRSFFDTDNYTEELKNGLWSGALSFRLKI